MPIYEYRCQRCECTFDKLRPFAQADAETACPACQSVDTHRMISLFASFSRDSDGSRHAHAGTAGCASCQGGHCATCRH